MSHPLHNTARWHKTARAYRRAHPLCEACLDEGLTVASDEVDHITPLSKDDSEENLLDESGLRALCRDHHRAKSIREARGDRPPRLRRIDANGRLA